MIEPTDAPLYRLPGGARSIGIESSYAQPDNEIGPNQWIKRRHEFRRRLWQCSRAHRCGPREAACVRLPPCRQYRASIIAHDRLIASAPAPVVDSSAGLGMAKALNLLHVVHSVARPGTSRRLPIAALPLDRCAHQVDSRTRQEHRSQ